MTEIYVFLLDEAVDVWRPVQASKIARDRYRISLDIVVPEGEVWEFGPGDIVRCEDRLFEGGKRGLVAVGREAADA